MTAKKKPRVTMLRGSKTKDVEALARLFEKMTGRKPTAQELKDAKKRLSS